MSDEASSVYNDFKAKAASLILPRSSSGFAPTIMTAPEQQSNLTPNQSEPEKLKDLIKKLFSDKNQLKNELDKEIAAHSEDVSKLTDEYNNLKQSFSQIAENIASKPPKASPEQIAQIENLTAKINEIKITIRSCKNKLSDAQLNHEVLQKQSDEYVIREQQLQEDLSMADSFQQDLALIKTQISQTEDEVREKKREIKHREAAAQWNQHEIQKMNMQIEQLFSNHRPELTFSVADPIYVFQPVINVSDTAKTVFRELSSLPSFSTSTSSSTFTSNHSISYYSNSNLNSNPSTSTFTSNPSPDSVLQTEFEVAKTTDDLISDKTLSEFILLIPDKIRHFEEENQRLLQLSAQYKRKFAKIKGKLVMKSSSVEERNLSSPSNRGDSERRISKPLPSPEKMQTAAKKLMAADKEKTEAIKRLKNIITRQHEGLQKVIGSPSTNTALSIAMRNVFKQMLTANGQTERTGICKQGVRILDAMLGIRI